MKHVYLIYTGGTIGMKASPAGYAPAPGELRRQMELMPELNSPLLPAYEIHEYEPLLDSSNLSPADWLKIAQDIAARYHEFDGFVVLHGTDTMAYSASALAFMLDGLGKPVILTGSQIPLCEVRNDARENLITALLLAANYAIPEVCLYFGDRLLRGCRARKVDAEGFEAFASPNCPELAAVGVGVEVHWERVLPPPKTGVLKVRPCGPACVASLRLFPGLQPAVVHNLLQPPLQGLVLEAYGLGNGPVQDAAFMEVLRQAIERGVVIVDCTQCLKGGVDLAGYATGSALAGIGVLSGQDMTGEAALAKLMFLLGQDMPLAEVKRLMQVNLSGEMSYDKRTGDKGQGIGEKGS